MAVAIEKPDLYHPHAADYVAHPEPQFVRLEPATYLAIAGTGEPGSEEFAHKLSALYRVAFTVKMASKAKGHDFAVARLEGLWWKPGGREGSSSTKRDRWSWKLLLRVPGFVGHRELQEALTVLEARGKDVGAGAVEIETLDEDLCVQAIHVGPYSTIAQTVESMMTVAAENGLSFHGLHHEIYLSDPRHIAPERLHTILRHPVR
jgi:hypothetical protein